MASHRKSRTRIRTTAPAVGMTTAAIASISLLGQSAQAAPTEPSPNPTVEEVQKKVDDLYRQAGTSTQSYNKAKEATDGQRKSVDGLLDNVAKRTEKLNDARRKLGSFAAAQYRSGTVTPTAALLLADSPQQYFDQNQLMDRMTERQKSYITDYEQKQDEAAKERAEATRSLEKLTESQAALKASKRSVQKKLAKAREMLSDLTAEEKARLAALEKKREAEATRKAEEKAKAEAKAEAKDRADAERKRQEEATQREDGTGSGAGTGAGTGSGTPGAGTGGGGESGGAYAAKAEKVLAFARAQIGKPYVWGAAGPSSYDCSGLTQGAWKAAGVDLPRTTWDQVKVGTRIATDHLKPGDLVFFYDDISHVGVYIGDGKMIHAPKPGAYVREESIYYMPIYGSVRPA
ncbi:C40 family peptidase [Streptomyces sp. H27-C3]|uniref:C40 family peptidase n=1 Tax=Streptomyces sp. H27-C3 TaxID=3046305 RepID=UPI0024BA6AC1|nr:C40 family peptidase [Streptomyces sp. H27-C3]MDJ0464023.1 NlpC/P60 family protein [Streptomyces sp. H27-C3]